MSRRPTKTHHLLLKSVAYGLYGSKVDCYAFSKASQIRYRNSPIQLIVYGPSQSSDFVTQSFTITRQFIELPNIDYVTKLYNFLNTYRVSANEPSCIDLSVKLSYYDRNRAFGLNLEKSSLEISHHGFNSEENQRNDESETHWLSLFDTGDEPLTVFKISRKTFYENYPGYCYFGTQAAIFTASQMDNLLRMLKYVAYSVLTDRTV